jgi:hypothetical protein
MAKSTFFERSAASTLKRLARGFPIVGITGPRQAGKTTLARHYFADKPYVSLENPDQLDFAQNDPRGFLGQFPDGAVLDEVQRCPSLFSWLQGLVDEARKMGQFILTGSQQFGFRAGISQTLAGRIGMVHLLPFSLSELTGHGQKIPALEQLLYRGFYPPVHDRNILPADWYASYVQTYIERDVQQLLQVKDLNLFRTFLRLCAGRTGQIVNLSSLGNDCGISHNTVKEWLAVLEASYILFRLPPHFSNFSKRLIKSSKFYFQDTGLLCWLLGIREPEQLSANAMRGPVFENFVIGELLKHLYMQGETPNLYFWRDHVGLEIDVIIDRGRKLIPVEIKAGQTITADYFRNLDKWTTLAQKVAGQPFLVYGGIKEQRRTNVHVLSWRHLDELLEHLR